MHAGSLDFTSWNNLLTTLFGLILVSVIAVGIRLVFMQTVQRRQQAQNRQINERLRVLIAAYKALGGSFTGDLSVDPTHRHALVRPVAAAGADPGIVLGASPAAAPLGADGIPIDGPVAERRRRVRDEVESALSDIILLGTEEQVRLAARAATEMVAGHPVRLAALVVSLRTFIRQALDLAPVPVDVVIPEQGPLRVAGSGGGGKRGGGDDGGGRGGDRSGAGTGDGGGVSAGLGGAGGSGSPGVSRGVAGAGVLVGASTAASEGGSPDMAHDADDVERGGR